MAEGRARGAVLAVDPGRDKCGVAVVSAAGEVLLQEVIPAAGLARRAGELVRAHEVGVMVVGDRTGADAALEALEAAAPETETVAVDEHGSTEEARRRYFRDHPPRGWRRLVPVTMQTPPRPYDDYVAVILARRYLERGPEPAG